MQQNMTPRAAAVARRLGLESDEIPAAYGRAVLTVHDLRRSLGKRRAVVFRAAEATPPAAPAVWDAAAQGQRMSFFYDLPAAGLPPMEWEPDRQEQWAVRLLQAVAQACPHISGLRTGASSRQDLTLAYVSRDGWALLASSEAAQADPGRINALLYENRGRVPDWGGRADIVIQNQMDARDRFSYGPGEDGRLTLRLGRATEQVVEKQPGYFEIIPAVSVSLETTAAQAPAAIKLLRCAVQQLAQGDIGYRNLACPHRM